MLLNKIVIETYEALLPCSMIVGCCVKSSFIHFLSCLNFFEVAKRWAYPGALGARQGPTLGTQHTQRNTHRTHTHRNIHSVSILESAYSVCYCGRKKKKERTFLGPFCCDVTDLTTNNHAICPVKSSHVLATSFIIPSGAIYKIIFLELLCLELVFYQFRKNGKVKRICETLIRATLWWL